MPTFQVDDGGEAFEPGRAAVAKPLDRFEHRRPFLSPRDGFVNGAHVQAVSNPSLALNGEAQKRWESESAPMRSEMRSTLGDALMEEEKLCDAFEKAKTVAAAMDAVATYNRELGEKIEALKTKWEESRRIAEAIMRDEAAVIEELTAVMKQAAGTQAVLALNRREVARAWVKAGADAASLVGSVLPIPQLDRRGQT